MGSDSGKRKYTEKAYDDNIFKLNNRSGSDPPQLSHSDPPRNAYPTELRSHHDPNKVLALLRALVRLFTNESQAAGSSGEEDTSCDFKEAGGRDPKTVLARVGVLLGAPAHGTPGAIGSSEPQRTLPKDEKQGEEEEVGNSQSSKRQKIRPRL
ncbi:hypothetical protein LOK49_LG10G02239 [Camellia lanceoleosa]|uniref:Uncharacterized protein n=1 Tax=Camellia lanceoleosa TaxID=1840588 RepID=A0ACC0G9I0_9ERIC|nr:hypothetical protein LOK49_LG10G02239 [Camellia lanceoleosa]